MAASSVGPAPRTAAAFCAMTELQTRATIATAASGMKGAARATALGACWFSVAPASTGTRTTCCGGNICMRTGASHTSVRSTVGVQDMPDSRAKKTQHAIGEHWRNFPQ